jgi:hypothetical protein
MAINIRDVAAGLLFVAIGLFFTLDAFFNLRIGQAFAMGPGYFPLIMGMILVGLGAVIAGRGIGKVHVPVGKVPWRGLSLVMASIIFFAVSVRSLGFAPAVGGSILLAALSSGRIGLLGAAITSAILTLFSVLVFVTALGLPYPLIARWITG